MNELKIFDNPKNVRRFLFLFYIVLVLLLIADFFIHKHAEFPWEGYPQFFGVYGFAAFVVLIFVSKAIRLFLKKDEDYYD